MIIALTCAACLISGYLIGLAVGDYEILRMKEFYQFQRSILLDTIQELESMVEDQWKFKEFKK
jgi:hypothetical protein